MPLNLEGIAKLLIFAGIVMVIVGLFIYFGGKYINLGKLPGDLYIEKDNVSFYFPIVTSILLSLILTLILNIFTGK